MQGIEKERSMIKEVAAKTAEKIVRPRAEEIDASGEFPRDLVEAFGRQGLLSVLLPDEYGGTNGDLSSFCVVIEEIAKVSGTASLLVSAQGVGTFPLCLGGGDSLKQRYFTQIAEKNSLAATTLLERGERPETASLTAKTETGGAGFILKGRQPFVIHGSIADFYTVFAAMGPDPARDGISAFVVDKETAGLRFGPREETVGMKGSIITDVIFEDCRIPKEHCLGEDTRTREMTTQMMTLSGLAVGAQAVGIAEGAIDFAIRYANERVQFGRPISSFQAIQFMIADMATQVEAARALLYRTLAELDAGAEGAPVRARMVKCYASDVAMKVATDAVQVLGGYGYMKDYPVERMMRDAKMTQVYAGSNQLQRLAVAEGLFKD